ncbi:hypothetical protein ES703_85425 [subsurface metagenome]
MAKRKYPSELNSRTVRLNIGDWLMLRDLSLKLKVTVAEAFHRLITETAKRERIVVPKSQIPMPAFQVVSQPTLRVSTSPTIAVNGNKAGVFVIKPKGGVIRD